MNEAITLFQAHAWAPLSILVMLWFYRALADDSKFPISWPAKWAKWKPLVIIVFGQVIAVTKAIAINHIVWYLAVEHGFVLAFVALGGLHILRLWWPEGSEPTWLKYVVLVFDQVTKMAPAIVAQAEKDDEPKT